MSFCPNCGAQIPDGKKFCSQCGSPAPTTAPQPGHDFGANSSAQQPYSTDYRQPYEQQEQNFGPNTGHSDFGPYQPKYDPNYQPGKKKDGKILIILLAVIAALAVLIILLVFKVGPFADKSGTSTNSSSGYNVSNPYERPVAEFFAAMESRDANKVIDLFPDDLIDLVSSAYGSKSAAAEALEESAFGYLDIYDDIRISYDIADVYHLDEYEIAELEDSYFYNTGVSLDITDAYTLGIYATIHADGEDDDDDLELTVIQCDGKWYLDVMSMM